MKKYSKNFRLSGESGAGFTLFEILIVIFILAVLAIISISDFMLLQKKLDVDNSANEITGVLRLAQSKSLASESDSKYGVYFDSTVFPNKYVLFKGLSYPLRDTSFDQTYFLTKTVELSSITLGGGNETVFEKLTGASEKSGSISVRFKTDASQTKTIYISNSGIIDFNPPSVASDSSRTKDSRHLHFDYSRLIDTLTENVVLTFDGTVIKTLPINTNIVASQFYWSGTVSVGGANQVVKIQTHKLNNPNSQFSVHRDRRFNNKTLKVTVSGDSSGSLAEYSADGSTTTYLSIYVSNFAWQ